jgi:hypothetical protein
MKRLQSDDFLCIKTVNTHRENNRQLKRSKVVFGEFHAYLLQKGLNEAAARRRTKEIALFVMDYLFVHDDAESILDVTDYTIIQYLGSWYVRNIPKPSNHGIAIKLRSFNDFFTFLNYYGFISENDLMLIKAVCKDRKWFEMRLKFYAETGKELVSEKNTGLPVA